MEKPKFSPPQNRFKAHYNSPFSLENCHSRLKSRAEKPTFWAWKGQTRIAIDTWNVDADTIGFQVHRVPKSMLQWNMGPSMTRARGLFTRQADGTTTVLVYAGTTLLGYMIYGLLMLAIWAMAVITFIPLIAVSDLIPTVTIAAAFLFGSIALSILYFDREHASLMRLVADVALGRGDEPFGLKGKRG